METKTVTVVATDGTPVTLNVPTTLPTEERAEYLRKLFGGKVEGFEVSFPDGDWKGRVRVTCSLEKARDAEEAMEFMGALPDRTDPRWDGRVTVSSKGYYAHGF